MLGRLCAVSVLVASIPIALAPPGAADIPAGGAYLQGLTGGLPAMTDFLIDHVHDQMLVAGPGGIDVTAANGSGATLVPSSPARVGGLALSDDSSTLWYSAPVNGTLVATDAAHVATATPVPHDVPQSACPTRIAVDGSDRVWFLYQDCATGEPAGLGVYDPGTDRFDLSPAVDASITDLGALDVLANNPATPDILVVASDNHTTTIDVATDTVHTDSAAPAGAGGVAVTSDGTQFARAGGAVLTAPTSDPGATVRYDAAGIGVTAGAERVALSTDDAHLAAAYGTDIVSFGTAAGDRGWVRRCEDTGTVDAMVWDGTAVWFVRDNQNALVLARCDAMTQSQSFIDTPASVSERAGTTFTAPIRLAYRDVPLAGMTISVSRSGQAAAATLPALVTDTDGRAVLQDTVRQGANDYLLTFGGDGTHPAYATSLHVIGTREATAFVTADGYLSGRVDRAVTVHNRLMTASGKGLGPRTLEVVRTDASGRRRLRDVTTDSAGRFTISDTPRYGPIARYYVSYAGEAGYLPARSAKYTVTVSRLRPDLRISLPYKAIWYDQSATVQIHLGHTYDRRSVSLYAVPAGGGLHRVLTGPVNRQGDLTASVPMSRNTRFYADFKGDPRYNPREVSATELSGLRPALRVSGGYGTSGKYHLYRANQYVKLTGTLLPARAGRCLQFDAFQRRDGRWVADPSSPCFTTNRHGDAVAYFHPTHVKLGVPYAIESFFAGDAEHCVSWSGFTYVEFTAASPRSASARTSWKGAWTIEP